MGIDRLQDDHTEEVYRFVQNIRDYIDPFQVKVIFDIGSRDACESITLKKFFSNAVIYAFECNPSAIELCRKNIANRKDIILVDKAVADVSGPIDFFAIDPNKTKTSHADGNIGASSLFLANPKYPYEKYCQNKIKVESVALKEWVQELGVNDIDIIWIDLQGAELKAFKGMGDFLSRVKIIYTEVEFKQIYIGQPLFWQVNKYLASKGFILLKIEGGGWFGNALYINKSFVRKACLVKFLILKYFTYSYIFVVRLQRNLLDFIGSFKCKAENLL